MNAFLNWWYRVSLPKRGIDKSPAERERTRYARLTTTFTLLLLILTGLVTPWSFIQAINPAAPLIASLALGGLVVAVIFNKLGLNIIAACLVVLSIVINATGNLLTTPLDPTLVPTFSALVIPVILAGALMPPVAALIDGLLNSVLILLIVLFQKHTPAYDQMLKLGLASVSLVLPILLQIIVAVVTYVIMRNLITALRRADRAEEIVALQTEIAEFERSRAQDQQQLAEGITTIAQVHAEVARGNLNARVPLGSEHVLWQVAVPLNNLLSRMQQWRGAAEQMEQTQTVLNYAVHELQSGRQHRQAVFFQKRTGTPVDPLLAEINYLSEQVSTAQPPYPLA